jgi:hypothetical protein
MINGVDVVKDDNNHHTGGIGNLELKRVSLSIIYIP